MKPVGCMSKIPTIIAYVFLDPEPRDDSQKDPIVILIV
jgi:hypothetical protein